MLLLFGCGLRERRTEKVVKLLVIQVRLWFLMILIALLSEITGTYCYVNDVINTSLGELNVISMMNPSMYRKLDVK